MKWLLSRLPLSALYRQERGRRENAISITSHPASLEFFDTVSGNFRLDTCPVGPRKKKNLEELQKSKREQIRIWHEMDRERQRVGWENVVTRLRQETVGKVRLWMGVSTPWLLHWKITNFAHKWSHEFYTYGISFSVQRSLKVYHFRHIDVKLARTKISISVITYLFLLLYYQA